jgi:hypothetical protein
MKKILLFLSLITSMNVLANDVVIKTNSKVIKELKADTAQMSFRIRTEANSKEKSQNENKIRINNFFDQLKSEGIKYDSLITDNYRYYKTTKYVKNNNGSKLYNTNLSLSIKTNSTTLASILEVIDKIGGIEYKINKGLLTLNIKNESESKEKNLEYIYRKVEELVSNTKKDFYFDNILNSEDYSSKEEDMYNIESTISFKLRDLKRISEVIEIAEKNKIELMGNIDYSVSNLKNEYLKMYKESYDKAKSKNFNLLEKGYKLKEVKNISEDRYIVDSLNRKINISNNDDEYIVDSYASPRAMKMVSLASSSVDVNSHKNLIDIPSVNLENSLNIDFVVTDGKFDDYENKAKIYADVNKTTKVDLAEISFDINTNSLESYEVAGKENYKVLDKIKSVLNDSGIGVDKFETEEYKTQKDLSYKNVVKILGNVKNEANILVEINGVDTKNYRQFIEILDKNNVELVKMEQKLFISIKSIDENVKVAYDDAIKKVNNLKSELHKIHINSNVNEYTNRKIENKKNESVKEEKYKVKHSIKLSTSDVKNISFLISLLSEVGVKVNGINYKIKNIDKYEKEIYNDLLKDIESKKEALNKLGDFKVVNISSLEELEKDFNESIYRNIYINSRNKINLNRNNRDIIDAALKNLENIKIPPYNMEMRYEVVFNIK